MKLNYKTYGSGPALIILHGLFGSLDNWVSHAKVLEKTYSVYLVDQRNHGKSPHDKAQTYRLMAEDLHELMDNEGIYQAHLLGHSMGGKTVMEFAGLYPDRVEKLIVADMAMRRYPPHHTLVLNALRSIDLHQIESRKAAEEFLMNHLNQDVVTTQFLLKGLGRNEQNELEWKFNLAALLDQYDNILAEVTPDVFDKPTLFISGGKSEYVTEQDKTMLLAHFPQAQFQVMPNAGHWVHAENPTLFLQLVQAFLQG